MTASFMENTNISKGQQGELAAADFLKAAGYTIIERNFKTRYGEIDIIADFKKCTVFVEVKTRTGERFGLPQEAVTYKKQEKIRKSALCYLQRKGNVDSVCRFDVIAVTLPEKRIEHIEDAF